MSDYLNNAPIKSRGSHRHHIQVTPKSWCNKDMNYSKRAQDGDASSSPCLKKKNKKKKTEPGELAQWAPVTVGRAAGLKTRELKRTKNMTMMEKKHNQNGKSEVFSP